MTRRTKVLLYTWLLSWAVAVLVFVAFAWAWETIVVVPAFRHVAISNEILVSLRIGERVFAAIAAAPTVYLCYRAADRFVPHDEDEE